MSGSIVSAVVALLASSHSDFQVGRLDSAGSSWVDSAKVLHQLLSSEVAGEMYPLSLPLGAPFPSLVYQRVTGRDSVIDGFPLIRTDGFVLTLRAKSFAELVGLVDQINTLAADYATPFEAGVIEVTDVSTDYESEKDIYRADLEVLVSHLSLESQKSPFVGVYLQSSRSGESTFGNVFRQLEQQEVAVMLVCPSVDLESVRDGVLQSLLGVSLDGSGNPIELAGGKRVDVFGHLTIWRESFLVQRLNSQA